MSTEAVLAAIDGTLAAVSDDCDVSGDAMRWSPERVICDGGKPLTVERKPAAAVTGIVRVRIDAADLDRLVTALYEAYARAIGPPGEAAGAFARALNSTAWCSDALAVQIAGTVTRQRRKRGRGRRAPRTGEDRAVDAAQGPLRRLLPILAPGPTYRPDQLLGARYDTPDQTGAIIDFEPLD